MGFVFTFTMAHTTVSPLRQRTNLRVACPAACGAGRTCPRRARTSTATGEHAVTTELCSVGIFRVSPVMRRRALVQTRGNALSGLFAALCQWSGVSNPAGRIMGSPVTPRTRGSTRECRSHLERLSICRPWQPPPLLCRRTRPVIRRQGLHKNFRELSRPGRADRAPSTRSFRDAISRTGRTPWPMFRNFQALRACWKPAQLRRAALADCRLRLDSRR